MRAARLARAASRLAAQAARTAQAARAARTAGWREAPEAAAPKASTRARSAVVVAVAGALAIASAGCGILEGDANPASPGTPAIPGATASEGPQATPAAALPTPAAALPTPGQQPPAGFPAPDDYAKQLFHATNTARAEAGLDPLDWSQCAADQAAERAAVTLPKGVLEHAPLTPACGDHSAAGENLVHSTGMPTHVVEAWLGSPGHAANILSPDFTELGVACLASDIDYPAAPALTPQRTGGMLCSQVFEGYYSGE